MKKSLVYGTDFYKKTAKLKRLKRIVGLVALMCAIVYAQPLTAKADTFRIHKDKTSSYKGKSTDISTYTINYYTDKGGTKGTYPTRAGVILTTNSGSIANVVGHSAIVYSANNVVESLSNGVCVGSNNWASSKSKVAASTVRKTTITQDKKVAQWCKSKCGKKYNYNYYSTNTRNKFYCSHLVWAGFKDNYGIDLNTSAYDIISTRAIGPFEFVRMNEQDVYMLYMKNWTKKDVTW